jgi:hypothetical protein
MIKKKTFINSLRLSVFAFNSGDAELFPEKGREGSGSLQNFEKLRLLR